MQTARNGCKSLCFSSENYYEFKGDNAKKQNKENLLKTKQHALQSKGVKQKQQTNKK